MRLPIVLIILLSFFIMAFGVSPASVDFPEGFAGQEVVSSIQLSSPFEEEFEVEFSAPDWVRLSPENPVISRGNPQRVTVYARLPQTVGDFSETIRVSYSSPSEIEGKQAIINQQLVVPLQFRVSGEAKVSCVVGGVTFSDFEEEGVASVEYTIKNTGNVEISPSITFLDSWSEDVLLPGQTKRYSHFLDAELSEGNYVVDFIVEPCDYFEKHDLYVHSQGSLTYQGVLEDVVVENSSSEDRRVTARFTNEGSVVITAQLTGQVLAEDGSVVGFFEGDEVQVLPKQTIELEEFISVRSGQNIVKSKVVYEGISSEEKEVRTILEEQSYDFSQFTAYLLLAIILIIIGIIRKKRNSR